MLPGSVARKQSPTRINTRPDIETSKGPKRRSRDDLKTPRERASAPTQPPPAKSGERQKSYAPARVDIVTADMSKDPRAEKKEDR